MTEFGISDNWLDQIQKLRAEVERLRALNSEANIGVGRWMGRSSAAEAELERLRAEIEPLRAAREMMQLDAEKYRDEAKTLRAEVERLRTALQRIADDGKNCQDYCRNQAARALEPKKRKHKP